MAGEWIRFGVSAVLFIVGIVCFISAVTGVWKLGFIMNRIHSAGIGDTMGALCVILSVAVASGFRMNTLKLFLIIAFLWCASPVSSHFLGQVEYRTNRDLKRHMRFIGSATVPRKQRRKSESPEDADRTDPTAGKA